MKLLNCFYDLTDSNKIITYDELYFVVINKTESMPADRNAKIFQQQLAVQNSLVSDKENNSALHISNKYRV